MKSLVMVIGLIVFIAGLFFAAQGSGLIPWPAESFMVSATPWIYYGLGIAVAGLLLMIYARR